MPRTVESLKVLSNVYRCGNWSQESKNGLEWTHGIWWNFWRRKDPPHIWVSPGLGKGVFPGPQESVALRFFSSSVQYSFSHSLPGPALNPYTFLSHLPLTVLIGPSTISATARPLGVRKQGLSPSGFSFASTPFHSGESQVWTNLGNSRCCGWNYFPPKDMSSPSQYLWMWSL